MAPPMVWKTGVVNGSVSCAGSMGARAADVLGLIGLVCLHNNRPVVEETSSGSERA